MPNSATPNVALFIRSDWERCVSEMHREYIQATFEEWANVMEKSPTTIPPFMLELSVGPLRTVEDGEWDPEGVTAHIESFLMGEYQRFVSP
jgi:hypothetical protein